MQLGINERIKITQKEMRYERIQAKNDEKTDGWTDG